MGTGSEHEYFSTSTHLGKAHIDDDDELRMALNPKAIGAANEKVRRKDIMSWLFVLRITVQALEGGNWNILTRADDPIVVQFIVEKYQYSMLKKPPSRAVTTGWTPEQREFLWLFWRLMTVVSRESARFPISPKQKRE